MPCFFGHHTCTKVVERDEHCGHSLIFQVDHDPYAESAIFDQKVRYRCGLFGHQVHLVVDRVAFASSRAIAATPS